MNHMSFLAIFTHHGLFFSLFSHTMARLLAFSCVTHKPFAILIKLKICFESLNCQLIMMNMHARCLYMTIYFSNFNIISKSNKESQACCF